ncbi:MAG TPA: FliA/WhiG family RNA polymerase sigma factor [Verrucomicrobiales bacterium]|nr:FliA/WhiG family RNA polymerase sigma factor [Verrucomicrobiales bacterium]
MKAPAARRESDTGTAVAVAEPAPTREQLWKRYARARAGSDVEEQLVEQYLPLVKTVVGRLAMTLPSHVDIEDLYSAGLVGLLNAMRNFDQRNGTSFETYARLRIRGSVFDELRKMDWVPRSIHDKARKIQAAMGELEQAKGRAPTESEMASALNLSLADYQQWMKDVRPATFICLDAAASSESDDGPAQYESVADPAYVDPVEQTSRREMTRLIADRLEELPEMQRKVLALYYFEDMRLREIAEAFGLTESRICQIHSQAILSIKSYLRRYDVVHSD